MLRYKAPYERLLEEVIMDNSENIQRTPYYLHV